MFFLYSNKIQNHLQYKKSKTCRILLFCLFVIFGVEMEEKDKDKKPTTPTTDARYIKAMEKQSTFQLTQLNEHLMKDLLIE